MTRAVPQAAIDLVKSQEGFRAVGYPDETGKATDGWGNTHGAVIGQPAVNPDGQLVTNLQSAAEELSGVIKPDVVSDLTDNQWSALIDFAFNLGTGKPPFPIWAVVNDRQYDQVPSRMQLYVKAGGLKLQDLVRRRAAEAVLWSTDEPGSTPVTVSSSVTRAVATPPIPLDPKPKGLTLAIGAAGTVVASAIPQAQGAVQAISDAITPYQDAAHIIGHAVNLLAVTGAGLAVAAVVFKYLRDRQVSHPPKSTAPALHPTSLALESQVNPLPPTSAPTPGTTIASAPPVAPAPVVASGAGTTAKPTIDILTSLRERLGRVWTSLTGEIKQFTGKTVSEIVAEVDKIGADLESKL